MSGDSSPSFDAFVVASMSRLRRLAYAWCRDPSRADDLVQAALERVYAAWPRVRRTDDPFAYTRTTMVRLMISEQRRPWYRREIATDILPDIAQVERIGVEDRIDLMVLIHRLPQRQRYVVLLRFVEDLAVAETASLLRCSEGTVKSQTHEAVNTLRGWYAQDQPSGALR